MCYAPPFISESSRYPGNKPRNYSRYISLFGINYSMKTIRPKLFGQKNLAKTIRKNNRYSLSLNALQIPGYYEGKVFTIVFIFYKQI